MGARLQERKEAEARRLEAALAALARGKQRERTRHERLRAAVQGPRTARLDDPLAVAVFHAARHCEWDRQRVAFGQLVLHLEAYADRLLESGMWEPLRRLARLSDQWIRPLDRWRPSSKSAGRQFAQLIRHLLAEYPVPGVMDSVFFTDRPGVRPAWFRHVGGGGNLRTARGLSAPLTKRAAHFALLAPEGLDLVQAIRWGQVRASGGDLALARALVRTRLVEALGSEREEAWRAVVVPWLAAQPMFDRGSLPLLLEFLEVRKREEPAWSLKGRTVASVLRLAEEWHADREREQRLRRRRPDTFLPSGFASWTWREGPGAAARVWMAEEVLTLRDLVMEGRAMCHCVATYAASVAKGHVSIWSLKLLRFGEFQRAVTVEVDNPARAIVQARGRLNRYPTDEELRALRRWAGDSGLRVALEHW